MRWKNNIWSAIIKVESPAARDSDKMGKKGRIQHGQTIHSRGTCAGPEAGGRDRRSCSGSAPGDQGRHIVRLAWPGAEACRCYDNARMESFFATLKKEKLYHMDTTKLRREDVKAIVFRYIHYYNLRRISSVNGGLPPLVYRKNYFSSLQNSAA